MSCVAVQAEARGLHPHDPCVVGVASPREVCLDGSPSARGFANVSAGESGREGGTARSSRALPAISRWRAHGMKIQPLGDRVVVEREEGRDKTAGGIVLPDTAKEKPQKGKVVAVGEGRITKDGKRRELQVKVGDAVLFTSYAGDEFKIDGGKKVLLMREDDILAVIEG
jgi:chaperonin GroES